MLASRVVRMASRVAMRPVPVMALSSAGPLDKRERAMEKAFFNKQDEELMRKLLKKLKTQADVHDEHKAKGTAETERSSLAAIVGKYNMAQEDIDALVEWRHDDRF